MQIIQLSRQHELGRTDPERIYLPCLTDLLTDLDREGESIICLGCGNMSTCQPSNTKRSVNPDPRAAI